jgi:hypothetical protein
MPPSSEKQKICGWIRFSCFKKHQCKKLFYCMELLLTATIYKMAQLVRQLPTMMVTSSRIGAVGQRICNRPCRSVLVSSSLLSTSPSSATNLDSHNNNNQLHHVVQQKNFVTSSLKANRFHRLTHVPSSSSLSIKASSLCVKDNFQRTVICSKRNFVSSSFPLLDYPSHQVVGLPSLSPVRQ